MSDERIGLPQGTLDLLILKVLSLEPQHGWAVSERLQQISTGVVQVQQGSLYPSLHRLERRGWITRERTPSNRRFYQLRLTETGLAVAEQLGSELRARHEQLLDALTPAERDALVVGLAGLVRALEGQPTLPPPT